MARSKTKNSRKNKFTAVVYFHGMGEQKRYEESSRLVDSLERYHRSEGNKTFDGSVKAKSEVSIADASRTIGYINLHHQDRDYRFYEAYWANITAGGVKSTEVLWWILNQVKMPINALLAPWREMGRLKRSIFLENWEAIKDKRGDNPEDADAQFIFNGFESFESPLNRRRFPSGTFANFIELLREKIPDTKDMDHNSEKMALYLARVWRWRFVLSQLKSLFVLITIVLALLLVATAVIALIGAFTYYLSGNPKGQCDTGWWCNVYKFVVFLIGGNAVAVDSNNIINIALFLLAVIFTWGGNFFLQNFMGDVYFWATYEESSTKHLKRLEILKTCEDMLKQAMMNEDCERIVIVAHSLGTTIAYDSILDLARYARSKQGKFKNNKPKENLKFDKVKQFITFASPIDKISYFFENRRSKSHQYLQTVDEIRGDIGKKPFSDDGNKPLIEWFNFWDKADIISGSLQGIGGRSQTKLNIENLQVRSSLFPEPGSAHGAYFENKNVIGTIYHAVFDGTKKKVDPPWQFTLRLTSFLQGLLLATPWLILAFLVINRLVDPPPLLSAYADSILWTVLGFLTAIFLLSLSLGHLDKLDE